MHTYVRPAKPRVVRALASLERPQTALCARSASQLAWAAHWHRAHTSTDPQAGVLIRRALDIYAGHLGTLEGDRVRAEEVALLASAKGSGSAIRLTECRARIEAADEARRPITLREALYRPDELKRHDEMSRALDAALAAQGL